MLQLLHSYCLDKDLWVIKIAQLTASALFSQPEGLAAWDILDSQPSKATDASSTSLPAATAAARHLQVFLPLHESDLAAESDPQDTPLDVYSVVPPALPQDIKDLITQLGIEGADIWTVPTAVGAQGVAQAHVRRDGGQEGCMAYEAWLCKLVAALLAVTYDPVLRLLRPLVR